MALQSDGFPFRDLLQALGGVGRQHLEYSQGKPLCSMHMVFVWLLGQCSLQLLCDWRLHVVLGTGFSCDPSLSPHQKQKEPLWVCTFGSVLFPSPEPKPHPGLKSFWSAYSLALVLSLQFTHGHPGSESTLLHPLAPGSEIFMLHAHSGYSPSLTKAMYSTM